LYAVAPVGQLVLWRLAIKLGRPVAIGVIHGVPLAGLPGNPVVAFITFAHVVCPLMARLAGERSKKPSAFPVRSGFAYRKKTAVGSMCGCGWSRARMARSRCTSIPQEGAGILSSLTATHGLVELLEAVTAVSPGDTVRFLSYDALIRPDVHPPPRRKCAKKRAMNTSISACA